MEHTKIDTFVLFTVPSSCEEYKDMNTIFKTGPFLIDPDQKKGSSTKFNVFCDFGDNGKSFLESLNYLFKKLKFQLQKQKH